MAKFLRLILKNVFNIRTEHEMKLTIQELQELESEMIREVSIICKKYSILYFLAYGTSLGAIRHKGPIPWDSDADIIVPYNYIDSFISNVRENLPDKFFLDYHDINPYYRNLFPRVGLKGYSTMYLHLDVFIACGLPDNTKEQIILVDKLRKLRKMYYYKTSNKKYRGNVSKKHSLKLLIYKAMYLPLSLNRIRNEFYSICSENCYDKSTNIVNSSGGYKYKEIMPKYFLGSGRPLEYSGFTANCPEKIELYLEHLYGDFMSFPPKEERGFKSSYQIIKLDVN